MRRYGNSFLIAGMVAVLGASLAVAAKPPNTPPLNNSDGSCDVDGVEVGWTANLYASPAPEAFRVVSVDIGDISIPSCFGATLSVQITDDGMPVAEDGSNVIGESSIGVANSSMSIPIPELPRAEDVYDVHVVLDGGEVPIPPECNHMNFEYVDVGTVGNDTIEGTPKRDILFGVPGNDIINGWAQADCIDGGDGDDDLNGESGNNVVLGGEGNDILRGGPGGDTAYGGPGNDTFIDSGGANTMFGGDDNDTLSGGSGIDRLEGNDGDDKLYGGNGNDKLFGGPGYDECYGGNGNDTFNGCEVQVQ